MSQKILVKNLQKHITPEMEDKHMPYFEKMAGYVGNGIYKIGSLHSTDTRELFLMFCAEREGLNFDKK